MQDSDSSLADLKPHYNAPQGRPNWNGLDIDTAIGELRKHLQTAVLIELYTIPLYLYAGYSIKDDHQATYKIMSVVKQEMLHLGLAGNILCSIGGTPRVCGREFTPVYPRAMFYDHDLVKVLLSLEPATKDALKVFEQVEEPLKPVLVQRHLILDYASIGDFYQEVKTGIQTLSTRMGKSGRRLFLPSTFARQFSTPDGSWADDDMAVITNLKAAEDAMEIIIEQGEGATSTGDKIPSGIQSHYEIFKELHKLSGEGKLTCYNVVKNIDPVHYEGKKFHGLMLACDAAYSYLLMTIEKMWQYDGPLRGRLVTNNIHQLMTSVLRPIATVLVTQPIDPDAPEEDMQYAGPPFHLYNFKEGSTPFVQLQDLTKRAVRPYANDHRLHQVRAAVDRLIDLAELK